MGTWFYASVVEMQALHEWRTPAYVTREKSFILLEGAITTLFKHYSKKKNFTMADSDTKKIFVHLGHT